MYNVIVKSMVACKVKFKFISSILIAVLFGV